MVLPASAWPEKTGTVTNTDRMVQMGRRALDPPGDARQDLWIIQQIARRIGLDWNYQGPKSGVAAVYEEMRQAMQEVIGGISWERLERESSVTYPCLSDDDPGQPTVFIDSFPTADGRVKLVPADIIPADERPDADYPFVLITGRQLEHWHTGSMTRRAAVLDAIEPMATASMNGARPAASWASSPATRSRVRSRRGEVAITVRRDDGTPDGAVFIPFAYYEAAANLLTNAALDPFGKIPEFKYCAVAISRGGTPAAAPGYREGGRRGECVSKALTPAEAEQATCNGPRSAAGGAMRGTGRLRRSHPSAGRLTPSATIRLLTASAWTAWRWPAARSPRAYGASSCRPRRPRANCR